VTDESDDPYAVRHMHHHPGWDTEIEAAKAILPSVHKIQAQVLQYAMDNPHGFTDRELAGHFGSIASTYRTRRAELVEKGLIKRIRRQLIAGTGRHESVWCLSAAHPEPPKEEKTDEADS
jgi:hypothetical protein